MEGGAKRIEAAIIAVLAAVVVVATLQAWGRSLHPIIDAGRDLYVPEQIAGGAKLYRDIKYYYPPLAPYLLTAVTSVTGRSIAANASIGLVVALLTAAVLYLFGRRIGDHLTGGAAAFLFLACSMANTSTAGTNYFFPYANAATIGMLLFVSGTFALSRFTVAASLLFALAGWTKIEFALFGAVVIAVAVWSRRAPARAVAMYLAALGAMGASAVLFFRDAPGWFRDNVIPAALLEGEVARQFYRAVVGLTDWQEGLTAASIGFAFVAAGVFALRWTAGGPAGATEAPTRTSALHNVAIGIFLAGGAALILNAFFAGFAIVQLALIPLALRERSSPLPMLLAMSLCASSRVFLRLMPIWYGFVFIVPLYLLVAYVLLDWLPSKGIYPRRAAAVWLLAFAAIGGVALYRQHIDYTQKQHAIVTARGTLYDDDPYRARILSRFFSAVSGKTLLVVPEGLTLNYLAKARNPMSFHTITPVEIVHGDLEARIVRDMQAHPPEFVAIVSRGMREFGYRGFGIDYGMQMGRWIREAYAGEGRWNSPTFQLVILRRKESVPAPTSSFRTGPPPSPREPAGRSSAPAESR